MFTASTWPYKQKILKIRGTFVYWGYKWGYKIFHKNTLTININNLCQLVYSLSHRQNLKKA